MWKAQNLRRVSMFSESGPFSAKFVGKRPNIEKFGAFPRNMLILHNFLTMVVSTFFLLLISTQVKTTLIITVHPIPA